MATIADVYQYSSPISNFKKKGVNIGETIRGMTYVHPLLVEKFKNRTASIIQKLYFVDAHKEKYKQTTTFIDPDCKNADKYLKATKVFFYDTNKNKALDKGEEVAYTLFLYVAKNGKKLDEAHECITAEAGEVHIFIEDNEDDLSDQVVRIKIAEDIRKNIKNYKAITETINKEIGFSQEALKRLVETGSAKDSFTISNLFFTSISLLLLTINAPAKAIGWVLNKIGDGIKVLQIPTSIWDTQDKNYVFTQENITKLFTVDTSKLDVLSKGLQQDPTKPDLTDILPNFVENTIKTTISSIKKSVDNYNNYISEEIRKFFEATKEYVEGEAVRERFAAIAGFYNGIVDFIAGIVKFIGSVLEVPYNLTKNFQNILESLDSFWQEITLENFWKNTQEALSAVYDKIVAYFKKNTTEDYDFVRIAYAIGFGIAFIATFFIPFANIAKIANLNKLKNFLPLDFFKTFAAKGSEIAQKSKDGFKRSLDAIYKLLNIFSKGKKAITEFFEGIWKKIADWFVKNKKMFALTGKAKFLKHLDDFKSLRPKFQNAQLVEKLWRTKIKTERLFPNKLRKLYNRYLKNYPNLKNGFNQAEFTTTIFKKGKKVEVIEEFSISGDKYKLTSYFGDPPSLPKNTINILDDYENYQKFVEGAVDFYNKSRKYDSEIKYIFNFLKKHVDKGDEFIIKTSNIFKTCGSCQREFIMLENYLTSIGKKVKIIVRSDETIKGTKRLKEKLKIK